MSRMMVHWSVTLDEIGCVTKFNSSSSLKIVVSGFGLVRSGPASVDRVSESAAVLRFTSDRLIERLSRKLDRVDTGFVLLIGDDVTLLVRLVLIGPLERAFLKGDCDFA